MTAKQRHWAEGNRQAWVTMLRECLKHLGPDGPEMDVHRWRIEREEAVAMLRQVCAEHGDNDWPDELSLADAIEKHLWRHLPQPEDDEDEDSA